MALVSGTADFAVISAEGIDARYPVTVEACPCLLPPDEIEGKTLTSGRVEVPQEHGKEDSWQIKLAFAVVKVRPTLAAGAS